VTGVKHEHSGKTNKKKDTVNDEKNTDIICKRGGVRSSDERFVVNGPRDSSFLHRIGDPLKLNGVMDGDAVMWMVYDRPIF